MPIVGKFFPSQKSQEKVFLLIRRHWFTYIGFLIMALITSIPIIILIVVSVNNPDLYNGAFGNVVIVILFIYLLLAMAVMLYGFIDYYLDVYIITNERIVSIAQNGFFRRDISELHLHQIQDVSARVEGILPTFIHYGDIHIQTAGERENFIFKSIPNPYRVSKLIVDLHEAQLQEGDNEHIAEQSVLEEYDEEVKGKLRDKVDLESADPKTLALASRRTKEFLHGGQEEMDLKSQVQQELSSQRYENLLDQVKKSKSFDLPDQTPETSSAPTPPLPVKGEGEGEMKEDEEIDF